MATVAAGHASAAATGLLWSKSLDKIPRNFKTDKVDEYYAARKTSDRNWRRSYKFVTESYPEPSSLETTTFLDGNATVVVVRGRCYRSQRKTGKPYSVSATIAADGSVSECSCQCAAKEGLCNHALALLRLIVLLKGQGYAEAPPEVTCTELPQQWRRPRGSQICAASVAELDWRSAREGGPSKAQGSRLYDARKRPRDLADMQQAIQGLGNDLGKLGDSPFAKHLRSVQVLGTASMFGRVPEGSPVCYQQPLTPHGFVVHVSPNIAPCSRDTSSTALPSWPELFPLSSTFEPATLRLSDAGRSLFEELVLTPDQARQLEKNSRQQSKSATWKAARTNRLTASSFGAVLIRESWTDVGLRNLTEEKDLSRVRAVKHGITQEPHAVRHYERALRSRGHQIQTTCCGLMVDPSSPWLGASPDRLVFDPAETPPHGVVEVKCPYTMWSCATPDSKSFFIVKDATGVYRLKRDHNHYYQLLGQMALSGITWGDFVVYCKEFLIIERIRFCPSSWIKCKKVLDKFYFETLLPYQVGRPDQ
ncbi:unnamed protein product [Ixodes hexagonus]